MKAHLRFLLPLAFLAACTPAFAQPAGTSISGLPAANALSDTEIAPIVQSGVTKKATVASIKVAFKGTTAPATPIVGQLWFDTTETAYVLKQYDGSAWVTLGTLDTVAHSWVPAGVSAGTVTTTGTPASGNLTKFSGSSSVTNADLSGDCTTSGTLVTGCTKTGGVNFAASATTDTTNAANIGSGTLPAARLPNPSASTLGGVQSKTTVSHQFLNGISTSGVPSAAQPAASDVSGLAASATTDTTNAANISSGTLPVGRVPVGKSVVSANSVLEAVLPIQTNTANGSGCTTSCVFTGTDLQTETRRSNGGVAMTDTLPAAAATGMVNGARITINNADTSASDNISAGAGTSISSCVTVPAGRSVAYVYDLANTTWRTTQNTCTGAVFASSAVGSLVGGNFVSINNANGQVGDSGQNANSFSPPSSVHPVTGSDPTITATNWANADQYTITGAGRTLTLPASSGLSPNGAIDIDANAASVTLTVTSPDTLAFSGTTSGAGGNATLPQGGFYRVTSDGAGHVLASSRSVTGTGSSVLANSPALVTPALGTPASGNLANTTGFPAASLGGLGTGVATALAANASGSGAICLASGSACSGGSSPSAPVYISGHFNWVRNYSGAIDGGTNAPAVGTMYFFPWRQDNAVTIQALGISISTIGAAGNCQIAVYAESGTTHRATGAPLATGASFSTGTLGMIQGAISLSLTANTNYWGALICDNATVKYAHNSGIDTYPGYLFGATSTADLRGNTSNYHTQWVATGQTFGTFPTNPTLTESGDTAGRTPLVYLQVN